MKHTAHEYAKAVVGLQAQAIASGAAYVSGASVDCLGFGEALVVVNAGAEGTGSALDIKIQEHTAATGTFTDVTSATFASLTAGLTPGIYVGRLDLEKRKRYLRVQYKPTGTYAALAVDFILMEKKYPPVTQVNALATYGFNV